MAADDSREGTTQDSAADLIQRAQRLLEPSHSPGPWSDGSGSGFTYPTSGEVSQATAYALLAIARQMQARTPRPIPGPIVVRRTRPVTLWQAVRAEPVKASLHLLVMLLLFGGVYGYLLLLDKWVGN